jgi:hypothetical protein
VGFYRKFAAVRSANPSLKALLYPKWRAARPSRRPFRIFCALQRY